jgi:hypothetical protein
MEKWKYVPSYPCKLYHDIDKTVLLENRISGGQPVPTCSSNQIKQSSQI